MGSLSYRALIAEAAQWGNAVVRAGLQRGDRIAFFLDDTPVYTAALHGAVRAGFVPVLSEHTNQAGRAEAGGIEGARHAGLGAPDDRPAGSGAGPAGRPVGALSRRRRPPPLRRGR